MEFLKFHKIQKCSLNTNNFPIGIISTLNNNLINKELSMFRKGNKLELLRRTLREVRTEVGRGKIRRILGLELLLLLRGLHGPTGMPVPPMTFGLKEFKK